MARVRSTARVECEGEETEASETLPISEAMQRSGLVLQIRRRSARIFTPGEHPLALTVWWTAETKQ